MLFDDIQDFAFFKMPGLDINNENGNLLKPKEALLRGNSFKDEYVPYKNYTFFPIKVQSARNEKLYKIMELCFIINDLNLYLDINPMDKEKYDLMKKYVYEKNRLEVEFDRLYGPISINDVEKNSYEWINDPWPWLDEGGSMYV